MKTRFPLTALLALALALLTLAVKVPPPSDQPVLPPSPPHTDLSVGTDEPKWVELHNRLEPVYLVGDDVTVGITLNSVAPGDSLIYPRYWPTLLRLTLTNANGGVIQQRPAFFDQSAELMRVDGDVSVHSANVRVRIKPLAVGKYHLDVEYGAQHASTYWSVVRGDETPAIEDWKLQRDSEHVADWDEFKRIAFKRLQLNPENAAVLFQLGQGGERSADFKETRGYYEAALRILRTRKGQMALDSVRVVEDILRLLPLYYADRKNLYIEQRAGGSEVQITLIDRRTGKPVTVNR